MQSMVEPVSANEPINPENDESEQGLPGGRRDDGATDEGGSGGSAS